jgi:CPA2 family monovalent cation:H+ antiporter-2
LTVLVRSVDDSHRHQIREAGAIEAIPASLETGLMIGAHVLLLLDIAPGEVMRRTRGIRTRRYQLLRDVFRRPAPDLPGQASASPPVPYLMSVTIQQGDHAVGHSLNELGLDTIGVIVTAIHHASAEHHDHASDAVLHSGDRLELFGIPQGLSQARNILVNG